MNPPFMTYPGGKGACFAQIINQIPLHKVYIETHLGAGSVMNNMRPAPVLNVGLDLDQSVIDLARYLHEFADRTPARSRHAGDDVAVPRYLFLTIDAVKFLDGYPFDGSEMVYADPPYLRHTRRSERDIYRFEYTERDHKRLLDVLLGLPCAVAISGYPSPLYDRMLWHPGGKKWRTIQFEVTVRSGERATEWLWMNYDEPEVLHDYRHLGRRWRERQRIHRQQSRWIRRLEELPTHEQAAMLRAIEERFGA